jgi:hypothetical protein
LEIKLVLAKKLKIAQLCLYFRAFSKPDHLFFLYLLDRLLRNKILEKQHFLKLHTFLFPRLYALQAAISGTALQPFQGWPAAGRHY